MADIVITWTPFALRCLDEIHFYISQEAQSFSIADKFIEKLFVRTNQLKLFPESGPEESILVNRGLLCRYLVEGNYKIVYEYYGEKSLIVILDVFHTHQNPDKIINR